MSALGTLKSSRGLDADGLSSLLRKEQDTNNGGAQEGPGGLDLASLGGAPLRSGALCRLFR